MHQCLALNPPQEVLGLVQGLKQRDRRRRGRIDYNNPMTVRLGGGQGFYGDGVDPVADVLDAGVDYLVCEALAELTLAILQKDRQRDERLGFTRDLPAYVRAALPFIVDGRTRFITNAGGINPVAAGRAVVDTLKAAGTSGITVATVVGDDVRPLAEELSLPPDTLFASVYLGARPIVRRAGAGRPDRGDRPGGRRVVVPRPARARVRLVVGRLGPPRRRRRRRPPHGVLGPGGRRQLLGGVVGEPRPAAGSASRSPRSSPTARP